MVETYKLNTHTKSHLLPFSFPSKSQKSLSKMPLTSIINFFFFIYFFHFPNSAIESTFTVTPPMPNSNNKKNFIRFPFIFKSRAGHYHSTKPWDRASACKHPKTLSFRTQNDVVFKTVNSIFFDPFDTTPDSSLLTNSSKSATNSTATESELLALKTVVRGARSERLFFELDDTSSILDKSKTTGSKAKLGFKESSILSIESENPYEDFRQSMGEMVESNGVRDWDGLEELLGWYLRANSKNHHGFIIGAFGAFV